MCGRLLVGKENLHFATLVGAAMCSACCGGQDRWPSGMRSCADRRTRYAMAHVVWSDRQIGPLHWSSPAKGAAKEPKVKFFRVLSKLYLTQSSGGLFPVKRSVIQFTAAFALACAARP